MTAAAHFMAKTSGSTRVGATPGGGKGPDAIASLKADHRAVAKLFCQFDKARDKDRKKALVTKICIELGVHMQIEEEIFYPASREFLDDPEIVDEAMLEHAVARDLMGELESMEPDEGLYEAKVTVLEEQIEHHVDEEETQYFPKVRKTEMNLKAVGALMEARKEELTAEWLINQAKAFQ